jgi:repressor LexA
MERRTPNAESAQRAYPLRARPHGRRASPIAEGTSVFLTKRQSQLLDYLRKTIAVQGFAPSLEEIAAHFDLSSVGTVHKHLKALEEKGVIRRQWNRSRAIEVLSQTDGKARRVPLLGRVSAGHPVETTSDAMSVAVPEDMLGHGAAFVLLVHGDSLRGESMRDGDFVVLEQRDEPRDGELVLALIDDTQAAVKRFYREGNAVRLEPSGDGTAPQRLERRRVRIHGIVLGILRKYS